MPARVKIRDFLSMDFFFGGGGLFLCHWLWHSNSNRHLFYYPKLLNKHIIVPLLPHCHCEWKSCQTDGSRHETARLERSLNFGVSDSSEKATLTHLGCQVSSSHTAGQGETHCYNKCSILDFVRRLLTLTTGCNSDDNLLGASEVSILDFVDLTGLFGSKR